MFTAIVLNAESQERLRARFARCMVMNECDVLHCHHVTLDLGDKSNIYKVGEVRCVVVIGFGHITDRVLAVRVTGASDSRNKFPHITLATNSRVGAKPAESNQINNWLSFEENDCFTLTGTVEVVS